MELIPGKTGSEHSMTDKHSSYSVPCCPTCNRADPAQETQAVWTARSPQENLKIAYRAIVNGDRFFGEALLAFERDRQRQSYRPEPLRIL